MGSKRVRNEKKSLEKQKPRRPGEEPAGQRHEVFGTLVLGLGVALMMALTSWHPGGGAPLNLVGPAGDAAAGGLFRLIGAGAFAAALSLLLLSVGLFRRDVGLRPLTGLSWLLVVALSAAMAHLSLDGAGWDYPPGGAVGQVLGEISRAAFGTAGSLVLLTAAGVAALVVATGLSVVRAASAAALLAMVSGRAVVRLASRKAEDGAAPQPEKKAAQDDMRAMVDELVADEDARIPAPAFGAEGPRIVPAETARLGSSREGKRKGTAGQGASSSSSSDRSDTILLGQGAPSQFIEEAEEEEEQERAKEAEDLSSPAAAENSAPAHARPAREKLDKPPRPGDKLPAIVEPKAPPRPAAPPREPARDKRWVLPSLSMLGDFRAQARVLDREALTRTAEKLTAKLADFGVQGRVKEIRPGPVVTMYEFEPGPGIKVSRIAGLADDLAMAMEAMRVRIVAPIPGKGVVGIEVPNRDRETVFFKEILEQNLFQKSASRLTMALGKDIEGMPYVVDLARMPHLLIAGTTGSGKSVSVNSMILSMLFKANPDEVKFLMVDPKMLELSVYEGIPHLLLPVVTDAKKAALALRWAVDEMERRYQGMARAGVRSIAAYNKWIEDGAKPLATRSARRVNVVDVETGEITTAAPEEIPPPAADAAPPKKLPYIVIIIDELADLMMVASREVETYIARLAQMARAAGLHLMVATQRPSTDVVTGVIKANFPARLSFKVASRHDSATIINTPGAENLLGDGDMLILPPGTGNLQRLHGGYVSEDEIRGVVDHWKEQGAPNYDMDILKPRAEEMGEDEDDQLSDELYDQALHAVSDMRQVSISLLQRKMRIGYNRAARMIERMERDGVVGAADGAKPREVLIRPVGEMTGA